MLLEQHYQTRPVSLVITYMLQTNYKLSTKHIHFKTSIPHVGSKQNDY